MLDVILDPADGARGRGGCGERRVGLVVAAVVFVWGALSARLERADLTAPIVFMAVGAALAGLDLVHASSAPELMKPLVEVTLVWVLFSDAARVRSTTCAATSAWSCACSPSACR